VRAISSRNSVNAKYGTLTRLIRQVVRDEAATATMDDPSRPKMQLRLNALLANFRGNTEKAG
jgi:hypothetical protein